MDKPTTWSQWNHQVVLRMDAILSAQGKHFPREYTLEDLQKAEKQATAELILALAPVCLNCSGNVNDGKPHSLAAHCENFAFDGRVLPMPKRGVQS